MIKKWISEKQVEKFRRYLYEQEKSAATVEKYIRDVHRFRKFLSGNRITRGQVLDYKRYLVERYKPSSVNSMLAALNAYLTWQGAAELRVKPLRVQRRIFLSEEKELTRKDYTKLLRAAADMHDEQLHLIMQTICATGIRISELAFITVEALQEGCVQVNCKNKTRYIWMPKPLCRQLKQYVRRIGLDKGPVFITRSKRPVSRSFVWKQMKKAAAYAGVDQGRVYPHNLRRLFARTFYRMNKDIIKLADILGHSSVETTRIYTMTTGREHAGCLERLGLVFGAT